ncbi:hypothetical protein ACFU96_21175 [Streptomyces sp. NPDC057620]|uniref:hypothetical protein n=1 Tax=Streptomyces sp. NPDC057620 TaxID=3346185 RepID=UPI0036CF064F
MPTSSGLSPGLKKLGADGPKHPAFYTCTVKCNLASRKLAAKHGDHTKGGVLNDRVQLLTDRASTPYIANLKFTAHGIRVGPKHRRDRRQGISCRTST